MANFAYYHYDPSSAAAIIFLILFLITTIIHVFQLFRHRTWYFMPFVIGGFFEWIGYGARIISARQTPNWTLLPYLIQVIFILVAPALFAASIYMTLGRIIYWVDGEAHSIVRRQWLTKVFVAGDVLSFLMQSSGGAITAGKTTSALQNGQHIIVGGLVLQIMFFGFFIVTASIFHYRLNRHPTVRSRAPDVPWKKHIRTLYIASAFILVRSLFRVIEYVMGNGGFLLRHEVFLYIFDACLMLAVMVLFNLVYPSQVDNNIRK